MADNVCILQIINNKMDINVFYNILLLSIKCFNY